MKQQFNEVVDNISAKGDKDANGNQSYLIKFADGVEGWFATPKEPPAKGEKWEHERETLTSKQGKPYMKITRVGEQKPFFKAGGGGRPAELPEHRIIGFSASYVKDCIVSGHIKVDEFEKYFELWFNIMKSKI